MPRAIRYKAQGEYLRGTLFWTQGDFIGANDADGEAQIVTSHKEDLAPAFGLQAADLSVYVVAWDGDPATLPQEDEPTALERLPVAPPPVLPNVPTFMLAVYAAPPAGIGKTRARLFARDYPDGPIALQRGNWALARQSVADAAANLDPLLVTLTPTEKSTILALMETFHIPLA
jgi:hypothetical protein